MTMVGYYPVLGGGTHLLTDINRVLASFHSISPAVIHDNSFTYHCATKTFDQSSRDGIVARHNLDAHWQQANQPVVSIPTQLLTAGKDHARSVATISRALEHIATIGALAQKHALLQGTNLNYILRLLNIAWLAEPQVPQKQLITQQAQKATELTHRNLTTIARTYCNTLHAQPITTLLSTSPQQHIAAPINTQQIPLPESGNNSALDARRTSNNSELHTQEIAEKINRIPGPPHLKEGYKPYGGLTEEEFYTTFGSEKFPDKYGHPNWKRVAPNNGFLGDPQIAKKLPAGIRLDRLGSERGKFMVDEGAPLCERSMHPDYLINPQHKLEYHTYISTGRALPQDWHIEYGKVAPAFRQPGGAHQWVVVDKDAARVPVEKLLDLDILRRVPPTP